MGEEETEAFTFNVDPADVTFTEAGPISKKRRRILKGKAKVGSRKKAKKGPKRKREIFERTKIRRHLLVKWHQLIAKRKAINKALRDNTRHRNQLVFHRQ